MPWGNPMKNVAMKNVAVIEGREITCLGTEEHNPIQVLGPCLIFSPSAHTQEHKNNHDHLCEWTVKV